MRANPTDAEKRLWSILRAKRLCDYKFKRQVIIDWYIADFINFEHRVIVEADGSQHADNKYDEKRDAYLESHGFKVIRFWNSDASRFDLTPSPFRRFAAPSLSRKGRGA